MAKNIDLENEGVPLLECLLQITRACSSLKRLRDSHPPGEDVDLFVYLTDLLLWGITPVAAFIETDPVTLDPFIEMVESGEYLFRLKQLRDKFVDVEDINPGPTPESDRATELYEKRKWGSMN